jgi:acetylornithine deacetylase
LTLERRTLPGEGPTVGLGEVERILQTLKQEDQAFDAVARGLFGRDAYEIEADARLPESLATAARSIGHQPKTVGMTFWTDAAILGGVGIPSVLFGPGGAGLHSTEEYVNIKDVQTCRDVLAALARDFTR